MMKKVLLAGTAFILLLGSCASLTKSQFEAVNQFARTSQDFSACPSKIMEAIADVRVKRGLYAANILDVADLHVQELDSNLAQKKRDLSKTAEMDITFRIIDEYARALLILSSDRYAAELGIQASGFGNNLDSLVNIYNALPNVKKVHSGTGSFVGSLIMAAGTQYIKSKQATEIKRYVSEADELIKVMTTNLVNFLKSGQIADIIDHEETEIQNNYKTYLNKLRSVNQRASINDDREFMELITEMDQIKTLRAQTKTATEHLYTAHHKLLDEIKEKKTIKEIIAELQALYDNVKVVKTTMQAMSTGTSTTISPD